MTAKYLQHAGFFEEAPQEVDGHPAPLVHSLWDAGPFGLLTHNIACPVCLDNIAVMGPDGPMVQPCRSCQADGWTITKKQLAAPKRSLLKMLSNWG